MKILYLFIQEQAISFKTSRLTIKIDIIYLSLI